MENNEIVYEELIKLIHESDVETLKQALDAHETFYVTRYALELAALVNRFYNNYAPFADYNDGISDGEDYSFNLGNEYFWKTSLGLDIEKLWTVDLDLGKAYLNYIEE